MFSLFFVSKSKISSCSREFLPSFWIFSEIILTANHLQYFLLRNCLPTKEKDPYHFWKNRVKSMINFGCEMCRCELLGVMLQFKTFFQIFNRNFTFILCILDNPLIFHNCWFNFLFVIYQFIVSVETMYKTSNSLKNGALKNVPV